MNEAMAWARWQLSLRWPKLFTNHIFHENCAAVLRWETARRHRNRKQCWRSRGAGYWD